MTANAKILDFDTLEEVAQKLGIDNPVSELEDIYLELLCKYNIPLSVCRDLYVEVLPYKGGYRLEWTEAFEHVIRRALERAEQWAAMKYEQMDVLEGVKFSSGKMVIVDPCSADEPDLGYTLDVAPVEWCMRVYKEQGGNGRPSVLVLTPGGEETDPKSDDWEAAPEGACNGHGAVDTGTVAVVDGAQVKKLLTDETLTGVDSWVGQLPYGYLSATENGDGAFGVRVMRGGSGEIAAVKVILP